MNYGLNVKSSGSLDFLSLGALVHRLDPGITPFRKAPTATSTSAAASSTFPPTSPTASASTPHRQRHGGLSHRRPHRRARPRHGRPAVLQAVQTRRRARPNMATVYSDRGQGVRAPSSSIIAATKPPPCSSLTISTGTKFSAPASAGSTVAASFPPVRHHGRTHHRSHDRRQGPRRSHLVRFELPPETVGCLGRPVQGAGCSGRIVRHVDVLVGNEEDLQKASASKARMWRANPSSIRRPSLRSSPGGEEISKHQDCRHHLARSALHQPPHLGAVAWVNGKTYQSPACELDVVDRVGGGDGYAAGFFYGLLSGASEQEAVNLGWATARC